MMDFWNDLRELLFEQTSAMAAFVRKSILAKILIVCAVALIGLALGRAAYPRFMKYRERAEAIRIAKRAVKFEVIEVHEVRHLRPNKIMPADWAVILKGKPIKKSQETSIGHYYQWWENEEATVWIDLKHRKVIDVVYY